MGLNCTKVILCCYQFFLKTNYFGKTLKWNQMQFWPAKTMNIILSRTWSTKLTVASENVTTKMHPSQMFAYLVTAIHLFVSTCIKVQHPKLKVHQARLHSKLHLRLFKCGSRIALKWVKITLSYYVLCACASKTSREVHWFITASRCTLQNALGMRRAGDLHTDWCNSLKEIAFSRQNLDG